MKIEDIKVFHCDAGWRPWSFIKITTDVGLVGWSECTDSHGSPRGIEGVVKDLANFLIGQDPRQIERLYWIMHSRTRQSPGSIIQKAIGGIENALLDIKAKDFRVPVYEMLGGPVREKIPVYWSHCGTSRVRAWQMVERNQIASYEDIENFSETVRASGFKTIKTNLAILDDNPRIYMPGFAKSEGGPQLNAGQDVINSAERWISSLRLAVGNKIDIIVDLNFNFKTEGYIKIGRTLEKYNLLWLEIDSYNPDALRLIRDSMSTPIASCENLYGSRQYKPFFERQSMDICSIDVIWNGFVRSKQIADMAELHEVNVTPHNYNGHLSTFISAQFCAFVPNLRIMEYDVDDVPWREELFTKLPKIGDGYMEIPKDPGWGTEINEDILKAHPWPR